MGHLERLASYGWRSHTEEYLDSGGIFRDAVLAILALQVLGSATQIAEFRLVPLEVIHWDASAHVHVLAATDTEWTLNLDYHGRND